jgi:hypothetical protein
MTDFTALAGTFKRDVIFNRKAVKAIFNPERLTRLYLVPSIFFA